MPEAGVWDPPSQRGDPSMKMSAEQVAALQSALLAGTGIAPLFLVAKTNQQYTRSSTNTAADAVLQPLYSFVLPGGCMGPNGTLHAEVETSFTDTATNATTTAFVMRIGTTNICVPYTPAANTTNDHRAFEWHNTAINAQKYRNTFVKQSSSATGFLTTAIDTSVDQIVTFDCQWSGATPSEVQRLESLRAWVEYGA